MSEDRTLRIGFVHPDLGIGGAERLVVDAAVCLQQAGHSVTVYTSHHDPARCFEETRDGTLDVNVRGDFLPRHVADRLLAPLAILRTAWAAGALSVARERCDVVFCDLVSHCIPLLKLARAPVVFYCHFPDSLLSEHGSAARRLYRWPIDRLEEVTTGMADRVLVNSRFTAGMFRRAFPRLGHVEPEVVHPGVDTARYAAIPSIDDEADEITVLAISRFEGKKNLGLAVDALAGLSTRLPAAVMQRVRLVIAGGYDERLADNRETLAELRVRAERHGLGNRVVLERSIDEARKTALLGGCRVVLYTPEGEHFGYVPVEAMAAGRPVVAVAGGGPAETVEDGRTGSLCEPTAEAFAASLAPLLLDGARARALGEAGRERARREFSLEAFGAHLEGIVREVARSAGVR